MERLVRYSYILGAVLVATGIWTMLSIRPNRNPKTEVWMEQNAPIKLGEFEMIASTENPQQSYNMGEFVYNELMPYGIVSRVFKHHNLMVDVVLIASDNKASFHDPKVCFSAQGWTFTEEQNIELDTPRGKIPATFVKMVRDGEESIGIYFYRGPGGFSANANGMKLGMFWERFKGGDKVDGIFYRFMPYESSFTVEDLKEFISDYMVEAEKTSKGYF